VTKKTKQGRHYPPSTGGQSSAVMFENENKSVFRVPCR